MNYLELRQENEEKELDYYSYVQIIKDALHLNKSVCLARNFHQLQKDDIESNRRKVFVDIWPVSLYNHSKFLPLKQIHIPFISLNKRWSLFWSSSGNRFKL